MSSTATIERAATRPGTVMAWLVRAAWVGVVVVGARAIDEAVAGRSEAVDSVAHIGGGLLWLTGVLAMAIPAVLSLTATRAIVPVALPAAIVAWIAGAGATSGATFTGVAALASVLAFSAEFGRGFVQASAYGDEDRYLLRPPLMYLIASGATWVMWVACLLAGPLLLASRQWIGGGLLTLLAVALTVWARPRWHKLSRRWFVLVPIGIVIHDQVVLAETVMLRRAELASLRLARAGTDAADLTGPATGHAIELTTHEPVTVILAATPKAPRGTAIHMTGGLVSPSRPGRVLEAARRRRLPVG